MMSGSKGFYSEVEIILKAKDIARELNISETTVSRALSGKGRVSQKTASLVREFAQKNNFSDPEKKPAPKTKNIGIVFPEGYGDCYRSFFLQCLVGAQEACQRHGYDLLVTSSGNRDNPSLNRMVFKKKVDGIILARTYENDYAIDLIRSENIPFITIGSCNDKSVICVDQDNYSSCKELTTILIGKGFKRLFLIGGRSEFRVSHQRLQGFIDGCETMRNLIEKYDYVMDSESISDINASVRIALRKEADCIICMDDNICFWALNELERRNIDIPLDIKIASFFDSEYLEHNIPPITSIIYDNKEIGDLAVENLISIIKNDSTLADSKEHLNYEIALRGSTH